MAALMKTTYDGYIDFINENSDPRVADWFLLGSPLYPLGLVTLYLYVVKVAGPRYMKNKSAYQLNGIITLYNVIQMFLNTLLFLKGIKVLITTNIYCRAVNFSNTPEDLLMAQGAWEYFMLKVLDLLETIFFVLRKRNNQVTTLHVYHHIIMILSTWFLTKKGSGGHELPLPLMNCVVHVFMYSYYLVANTRPEYKNTIWWKKYITQLQMIQFAINMVYFMSVLIVPNCHCMTTFSVFIAVQNLIMFLMFYDFYRKAYKKQKHI